MKLPPNVHRIQTTFVSVAIMATGLMILLPVQQAAALSSGDILNASPDANLLSPGAGTELLPTSPTPVQPGAVTPEATPATTPSPTPVPTSPTPVQPGAVTPKATPTQPTRAQQVPISQATKLTVTRNPTSGSAYQPAQLDVITYPVTRSTDTAAQAAATLKAQTLNPKSGVTYGTNRISTAAAQRIYQAAIVSGFVGIGLYSLSLFPIRRLRSVLQKVSGFDNFI